MRNLIIVIILVFILGGCSQNLDNYRSDVKKLRAEYKSSKAIDLLEKKIEQDPEEYDAYVLLGNVYRHDLHNMELSEESYKKAIEVDPTAEWSYRSLMSLYTYIDAIDKRNEVLFDAVENINSIEYEEHKYYYVNNLAAYYQSTGDTEKCREYMEEAVLLDNTARFFPSTYLALAGEKTEEGEYEEVIDYLTTYHKHKDISERSAALIGHAYYQTGDKALALKFINKALKFNQIHWLISLKLDILIEFGFWQETIDFLEPLVNNQPEMSNERFMLAQAYMVTGDFEKAINQCKVLQTKQDSYYIRKVLSQCNQLKGDYESALTHIEKAIELVEEMDDESKSNIVDLYIAKAQILFLQRREAESKVIALDIIDQVLKMAEKYGNPPYGTISWYYYVCGEYEKALEYSNLYFENSDENDMTVYSNTGLTYLAVNNLDMADLWYQKAMDRNPELKDDIVAIKEIESLATLRINTSGAKYILEKYFEPPYDIHSLECFKETGYLKLTSNESNVDVYIDDELVGQILDKPFNTKLSVGKHKIMVKKQFFMPNTINIEIKKKSVFSYNFELVKATGWLEDEAGQSQIVQATGNLTIVTTRNDLSVYIEGIKKIPPFELKNIASGIYSIKIVGPGINKTLTVTVEDNENEFIDLDEII